MYKSAVKFHGYVRCEWPVKWSWLHAWPRDHPASCSMASSQAFPVRHSVTRSKYPQFVSLYTLCRIYWRKSVSSARHSFHQVRASTATDIWPMPKTRWRPSKPKIGLFWVICGQNRDCNRYLCMWLLSMEEFGWLSLNFSWQFDTVIWEVCTMQCRSCNV